MAYLTQQHQIGKNHAYWKDIDTLCLASRFLRNSCRYYIRQYYFKFDTFVINDEMIYDRQHLAKAFHNSKEYRTDKHPDIGYAIATKAIGEVFVDVEEEFSAMMSRWKLGQFARLPNYTPKDGL